MELAYRTRGSTRPQGKERVYFACHPQDFDLYFESVVTDIFQTQNCAIYYAPDLEAPWPDMDSDLSQIQLFVIPITTRFLTTPNRARDVEFPYAVAQHKPVLPLMMEGGLQNVFQKVCWST